MRPTEHQPGPHDHDHHGHRDHPHFGPPDHGEGPPFRRRGGPGRAPRGDVRQAVLLLLADQPMHGYQLMQAIAERSGGRWTPSPGAIYPTISQLEDEGLVRVTADAGRKLVTLTDAGRRFLQEQSERPDPFGDFGPPRAGFQLRGILEGLHGAAREVARNGNEHQVAEAARILQEARRAMYLILAGDATTEA
jgi:DNA-binding PadR family transcriptional regulator